MTATDKWERMREEAVLAYYEVLCLNIPERKGDKHRHKKLKLYI
jgi:hypothetical protein